MWLEDFQKALILLEEIEKGIKIDFEINYCGGMCVYLDKNWSFCRLFNQRLKVFSGNHKHCRIKKCKDIFGD